MGVLRWPGRSERHGHNLDAGHRSDNRHYDNDGNDDIGNGICT